MATAAKIKKGAKVTAPSGLSANIVGRKTQIVLGGASFDVSIKKMLQADPAGDALQRLCSCCHKPFTQTTACPKGKKPWSAAAEKRGEDTKTLTPVVYGILTANDSYVVIDPDVLEAIDASTTLTAVEIEEVVPKLSEATPNGFPLHLGVESYYVAADKDVAGAVEDFAVLVEALTRSGDVAVARWSPTSKGQRLVGLHAVNGVMVLTCLPFGPEVRAPDEASVKHQIMRVDEADVAAVLGALDAIGKKAFDHDAHENEAIPERRKAIDKALRAAKAGRKPKIVRSGAKPAPSPKGGSLAERLGKGGAAKATPAKRRARAK